MYRKFVCNLSVSMCGTFFSIEFSVQMHRTGFCCLAPIRSWWGCFFPSLSHRGWIPAAFLCIENQRSDKGMVWFCQKTVCDLQNKMVVCSGN